MEAGGSKEQQLFRTCASFNNLIGIPIVLVMMFRKARRYRCYLENSRGQSWYRCGVELGDLIYTEVQNLKTSTLSISKLFASFASYLGTYLPSLLFIIPTLASPSLRTVPLCACALQEASYLRISYKGSPWI